MTQAKALKPASPPMLENAPITYTMAWSAGLRPGALIMTVLKRAESEFGAPIQLEPLTPAATVQGINSMPGVCAAEGHQKFQAPRQTTHTPNNKFVMACAVMASPSRFLCNTSH